jgi:hypothetical protein
MTDVSLELTRACKKCRKVKKLTDFKLIKNNFSARCLECNKKEKERRNSDAFLQKKCEKLQVEKQIEHKKNESQIHISYKFLKG